MGTLLEVQRASFILSHSRLRMKMFQTEVIKENQNTHFMFNNFFYLIVPCMR